MCTPVIRPPSACTCTGAVGFTSAAGSTVTRGPGGGRADVGEPADAAGEEPAAPVDPPPEQAAAPSTRTVAAASTAGTRIARHIVTDVSSLPGAECAIADGPTSTPPSCGTGRGVSAGPAPDSSLLGAGRPVRAPVRRLERAPAAQVRGGGRERHHDVEDVAVLPVRDLVDLGPGQRVDPEVVGGERELPRPHGERDPVQDGGDCRGLHVRHEYRR